MILYSIILAIFFIAGSLVEFWLCRKEDSRYFNLNDFRSSVQLKK